MYYPFNEQRGAYKVLMRNRFIFVKNDLHPVMENIVLLHELGHDALHREEATKVGGFKEFEIFNMRDNRMEYEANLFAAQISLSDEDFLELAERGYDTQQIARTLNSDINLVALKADTLISQSYRLRQQEHCNDFLTAIWRKRPFVSAPLSMPLAEFPSCRSSRRQGMAKIERAFAQWYNRIG